MLTKRIALFVLLATACTDVPASVTTEEESLTAVEVLSDMVAAGEISEARAQIFIAALELESGQVLMVRDVGDEPDNLIRSLGVIVEDDSPVELYLTRKDES